MSEQPSDQVRTIPAEDVPTLPSDSSANIEGLLTLKNTAETLVGSIIKASEKAASRSNEIEANFVAVQSARTSADSELSLLRKAVSTVQKQAESAKTLTSEIGSLLKEMQSAKKQADGARATITEIENLFKTMQAVYDQSLETRTQVSAAHEGIKSIGTSTTEVATRIEGIRIEAEQTQQLIAQKSVEIEEGRKHLETVRGELDAGVAEAQQSAAATEAQHQAARTGLESINDINTSAQASLTSIEGVASSVAATRKQCDEHMSATKKLADIATETEIKIDAYESTLAAFAAAGAERLKTIESLLPGATSAGLASAFQQRREHFKWPQRNWQGLFVLCVLGLLGLAGLEFNFVSDAEALSFDRLGLSLLHRLPFALPLIWLAFYASHNAALAQRLEEDYSFKETVSRSFEGFRREMAELQSTVKPDSPMANLCTLTLNIITRRPGLIYEKHALTKTPIDVLTGAAKAASDLRIKPGDLV
jgi:uncharacterized coiled-coil DUF342 family protein